MNLKKEQEHKLLGRKSLIYEIEHAGQATPTKKEIKETVATTTGAPAEKITIKSVNTRYGTNTSTILAHLYEDEAVMNLLEPPRGKKPAKTQ